MRLGGAVERESLVALTHVVAVTQIDGEGEESPSLSASVSPQPPELNNTHTLTSHASKSMPIYELQMYSGGRSTQTTYLSKST